jgi:hypothetical protein
MSTLFYTFGVGTAAAMHEQLGKMKQSDLLVCVIPPKQYLTALPQESMEEMKAALSDPRVALVSEDSVEKSMAACKQRTPMLPYMDAAEYLDIGNPLSADFPMAVWREALENQIQQTATMTAMLINTSNVSVRNYFLNAYDTLAYQNWDSVAKAMDRPLVLVGMGPSMVGDIATLRKLQGKVFIGATDNSLRYIAHHGIEPDFVFQVEWQERSMEFYHGVEIPEECTLVALSGVHPSVLRFWKGPKLCMPNYHLAEVFNGFVNETTRPFTGTNVGTLAIQFALRVRPKETWLVGFDFGTVQACYYHPGSISLHDVYPTVSRFWSVQKMDYGYHLNKHDALVVEDRHGKPMHGITSFESDRNNIAAMVATEGIKFFNASSDGRPVPGVEYRPLSTLDATDGLFYSGRAAPEPYLLDKDALIQRCDEKLSELAEYDRLSARVHGLAVGVCALHDHGHKIDTALRDFGDAVSALQSTSFGWVESIVSSLEPRIRHVFLAETISAKDLPGKTERLLSWAKIVVEFYPPFSSYRKFIEDFLMHTKQKAKV